MELNLNDLQQQVHSHHSELVHKFQTKQKQFTVNNYESAKKAKEKGDQNNHNQLLFWKKCVKKKIDSQTMALHYLLTNLPGQ